MAESDVSGCSLVVTDPFIVVDIAAVQCIYVVPTYQLIHIHECM